MKALIAADGDRILGFAMIGAEAGEVMAMAVQGLRQASLAMKPKSKSPR